MFYGQYTGSIDTKGRLALPRAIREGLLSETVIVGKGFDSAVFGYDKQSWEEVALTHIDKSLTDEQARETRRAIFSTLFVVKADDVGRIVLPQRVLQYGGFDTLPQSVAIIGAGDHFEIWRADIWEGYLKEHE